MPLLRALSSRARFVLTGPDRVRFLHGMVTNDIERLTPGMGCRAAMLTVKGETLAELLVYADPESLLIELDGELRQKMRDVFLKHLLMDDVELSDITDESAETGVYGAAARAALERALGAPLPDL